MGGKSLTKEEVLKVFEEYPDGVRVLHGRKFLGLSDKGFRVWMERLEEEGLVERYKDYIERFMGPYGWQKQKIFHWRLKK